MPSEEAAVFYDAVYQTVKAIPQGLVTTYGHIAKMVDRPQNARQVGQALKFLPDAFGAGADAVPWWRVVSAKGRISPRGDPGGEKEQRERLVHEGVVVEPELLTVELATYGWFPSTDWE